MMYEQIVIGAGASSLMFGSFIKDKQNSLIIEHNNKIGAKILISGGGRCNFTNKIITSKNYLGNQKFIKDVIKKFDNNKVKDFFIKRGLEVELKNNTQYFCKNSSKELLDILKKEIKEINVVLNEKVLEVRKENNIFKIITNKNIYQTKRVIIASGGVSYKKIGASDIGFKIAKKFNIKITPLKPALVGLTLQKEQHFFKELSGISIFSEVRVKNNIFKENILFAHKGISGPAILNASLFWDKGEIEINFLPNFNLDNIKNSYKAISNSLPLPKRFTKAFLNHINLKDKIASKLDQNEFSKLLLLQAYKFAPAGTFGFEKAEVTKGGVCIDEIDKFSLMSKKVNNLFFIGEVLNIAGIIGGFNLQFAFSSAFICANWINKSKF